MPARVHRSYAKHSVAAYVAGTPCRMCDAAAAHCIEETPKVHGVGALTMRLCCDCLCAVFGRPAHDSFPYDHEIEPVTAPEFSAADE